jgi:3-deoxy-manno-octulosonate cytidylyltransferase (CMP-KDO synthetase)
MIEHVCGRAALAPSVAAVVVATDDERIARAVEAFGGIAWMTKPDRPSGSDRLAEVASELRSAIIVNVQGDEPLVEPAMIEQAIAPLLADSTLVMSTLRRRIVDADDWVSPNVVKVTVDRAGFALYFSRAPVPFVRRPRDPSAAGRGGVPATGHLLTPDGAGPWKHIGLYVYRREFLLTFAGLSPTPLEQVESLEQLRALEHGYRIMTVETDLDSIGVDTPEDLERVRRLVAVGARR